MPPLHAPGAEDLSSRTIEPERDELDRELLAASASGDRAAFDALVEAHQAGVLRFIRMLVHDDAAAEDVLQEAFLAAYRGAAGFRGEGRVRSWLFTIARRCALRSARVRAPVEASDEKLDTLAAEAGWGVAPEGNPELAAEAAERRRALHRALASLPSEDRAVITLHDLEQLTGPETAAVLDLSLTAMKSRLHRARLRLMAALRALGVGHAR